MGGNSRRQEVEANRNDRVKDQEKRER
jgi:hypothetical protein